MSLLRDCSSTETSGLHHHEDCQEGLFFIIFLKFHKSVPFHSLGILIEVQLVLYFEMSQYALFFILSTSTHFCYDPAKVSLPFVL